MTYFIKLNDVGVSDKFEDVNLSGDSLNVTDILNFVLF
jgi:hypothetical protein